MFFCFSAFVLATNVVEVAFSTVKNTCCGCGEVWSFSNASLVDASGKRKGAKLGCIYRM